MNGALVGWLMTPDEPELPTLESLIGRPRWMARAACRDTDRDLFFPSRGDSTTPAKPICAGCIVRSDCLAYAMQDSDIVGVWGGTSAQERQRLRSALPAA